MADKVEVTEEQSVAFLNEALRNTEAHLTVHTVSDIRAALSSFVNRLAHQQPASDGLAEQIQNALDDYHDALPQGQGDPGWGSVEKGKALCQLFYDNAEAILAALSRPTRDDVLGQGTDQ